MKLQLPKFKEVFKSDGQPRHLKKPLIILAGLVVLLLVFSAGVLAGIEKTRFSYGWRENYYRNFIGERGRPMTGRGGWESSGMMGLPRPPFDDYFNARGVFGEIIKIGPNTASTTASSTAKTTALIIKDKDNTEKNVLISDQTVIKKHRQNLKAADLTVGERIVVIGSPNEQGQIVAKLIRVSENFLESIFK